MNNNNIRVKIWSNVKWIMYTKLVLRMKLLTTFSLFLRSPLRTAKLDDIIILSDVIIEQSNWDTSKAREKLQRDIDAHAASVRAAKLSELTSSYEVRV